MIKSKEDILAQLSADKPELEQRFGVVSIGLFGSYSRGDASEISDIDIAIEIVPERKSLGNFLSIRHYLEQRLGKTVDLGIESNLKPLAKDFIDREIIHV